MLQTIADDAVFAGYSEPGRGARIAPAFSITYATATGWFQHESLCADGALQLFDALTKAGVTGLGLRDRLGRRIARAELADIVEEPALTE